MKIGTIGVMIIIGLMSLHVISSAQYQTVAEGRLPYRYLSLKIVPVHRFGNAIYVMVMGSYYANVYCYYPGNGWQVMGDGYWNISNPGQFELSTSRYGNPYVYDDVDDTLYHMYYGRYYSDPCPGRPVLDIHDNIHLIWRDWGDTLHYFYGFSSDTLRTLARIDTLTGFPTFISLVSSPNDSIVGAIFYNSVPHRVSKYLTTGGVAINFSSPPETLSCDGLIQGAYDLTLDNNGDLYYVANVRSTGFSGWHCAWSENYGYGYLEQSTDDINDCPGFEFTFGPHEGEILIIKGGTPPHGYGPKFFATTDGGNAWYGTSYPQQPGFSGYYGSAPRTYSDTIDYVHFITYPSSSVRYYAIPRDSIFGNLTAIDEANVPMPANISLSNHPNPFNATTLIEFDMPRYGHARLAVYDIQGHEVSILTDQPFQPGRQAVSWDGQNSSGHPVSSGIYFYKLSIDGDRSLTKRMLLLK